MTATFQAGQILRYGSEKLTILAVEGSTVTVRLTARDGTTEDFEAEVHPHEYGLGPCFTIKNSAGQKVNFCACHAKMEGEE